MSDNVTNKGNKNKVGGFKVSDYEHKILKQYAHIFHNQMIEDPDTKEYHRLLESIHLAVKTLFILIEFRKVLTSGGGNSNSLWIFPTYGETIVGSVDVSTHKKDYIIFRLCFIPNNNDF